MDDFKQLIVNGDFSKAKQLYINMDFETLTDTLYLITYDEQTISSYGFVNYLLLDKESSKLHYLASYLLSMGLNHLQGAYQTAFFHAKKAVELSPHDNSYKEYLLFFYEIPDQLLTKEEARDIAKEILKKDPENKPSLSVLKEE